MNLSEMNSTDFDNFLFDAVIKVQNDAERFQKNFEAHRAGTASGSAASPEKAIALYRKTLQDALEALDSLSKSE